MPVPVPAKNSTGYCVWVLRDGKLYQTSVELGVSNGILQQVVSGLKRGDKVALQYKETHDEAQKENAEENPFMPKPPGAGKKK